MAFTMLTTMQSLISRRSAGLLLFQALLWAAVAGCVAGSQAIKTSLKDVEVARLSGMPEAGEPLHAVFGSLTEQEYQGHLRRIIVAYAQVVTFDTDNPVPLFSDSEVLEFARILAAEMPGLKPDQRLEFKFKEREKRLDVVMEVSKEGALVVFRFTSLARDLGTLANWQLPRSDRALLMPRAGQIYLEHGDSVVLKEPVRRTVTQAVILEQDKLNLIEKARREEVIGEEEAENLKVIAHTSSGVGLQAFEKFLEKRKALQLSVRRNQLTQAQFQARLGRLMAEIQ